MNAANTAPTKYDPDLVARVAVEEVLRLHPERLTVGELSQRVVNDPGDEMEIETAAEAIHDLRASGVVRYREDDRLVEPTHAVLRYVALLRSP
jgi:hypothetical protein